MSDDGEDVLVEAMNQLQQEIGYVVKNLYLLTAEMKDIKVELQAMRRNSSYLKQIAENLEKGLILKK
jgi:hypothetical protein